MLVGEECGFGNCTTLSKLIVINTAGAKIQMAKIAPSPAANRGLQIS
jgi:hypothetical protein